VVSIVLLKITRALTLLLNATRWLLRANLVEPVRSWAEAVLTLMRG